ncbi:MAG: 4'-phosphopantetheinyl transferase superfamily protein [Nitrolancea sp.]
MSRNASQRMTTQFETAQRTDRWEPQTPDTYRRDEVTIWWANLSGTHASLGPQEHLLSNDELRRAGWMSQIARDRWITGRASLRSILSGYLGLQALAVPITYGALGKPELANLSPVRLNLSHSADLAAFAVAWRKPVGIDIQRLRDNANIAEMAEWTMSASAYRDWLQLPEQGRRVAFTRSWVRKEAYLKGRGLGLIYPMKDLEIVEPVAGGPVKIVDQHEERAGHGWHIFDLATPAPGYVAALAVCGEVSSLIARGWPDGSIRTDWELT